MNIDTDEIYQKLKQQLYYGDTDFQTADQCLIDIYRREIIGAPILLHFSSPAMCELAANYLCYLTTQPVRWYSQIARLFRISIPRSLDNWLYTGFAERLAEQYYNIHYYWWHRLSHTTYLNSLNRAVFDLGERLIAHWSDLTDLVNNELRHAEKDGAALYVRLADRFHEQLNAQANKLSVFGHTEELSREWGQSLVQLNPIFLTVGQHLYPRLLLGGFVNNPRTSDPWLQICQWHQLAEYAGPWAAWPGVCIISGKPSAKLANSDLTVRYPDGWTIARQTHVGEV